MASVEALATLETVADDEAVLRLGTEEDFNAVVVETWWWGFSPH